MATSSEPENGRRGPSRVIGIATLAALATAIAALAGVWLSWRELSQFQAAQLLNRRVEACLALTDLASEQIIHALDSRRPSTDLEYQRLLVRMEDSHEQTRRELQGLLHLRHEADLLYSGAELPDHLPGVSEAERRAIDARRTAIEQNREIDQLIDRLRVDGARTFDLLGPTELAEAEERLTISLSELRRLNSARQNVNAAIEAHEQFRHLCRTAVIEFRGND